jgi:hypothetical protein
MAITRLINQEHGKPQVWHQAMDCQCSTNQNKFVVTNPLKISVIKTPSLRTFCHQRKIFHARQSFILRSMTANMRVACLRKMLPIACEEKVTGKLGSSWRSIILG